MGVFDKFSGINVASGFKLQAKTPIDPRQVVDTVDDRNALITENGAYEGMQVYVKADKKTYLLKDLAAGTWEELGSGGGGGGTSVQADYNQNDSTAADYIKNRPFYEESNASEIIDFKIVSGNLKEEGSEVTVEYNGKRYTGTVEIDSSDYILNVEEQDFAGWLAIQIDKTTLTMYHKKEYEIKANDEVVFNGAKYIVQTIASGESAGVCYISDGEVDFEAWKTITASFVYLFGAGSIDEDFLLNEYIIFNPTTNVDFNIKEKQTTLKTIDPKYIKDMYYEETSETEVYSGMLTTEASGSKYKGTIPITTAWASDGDTAKVTVNGVEYLLPVQTLLGTAIITGDEDVYGIKIQTLIDSRTEVFTNTQYIDASFSIEVIKSIVHQIPDKYVNVGNGKEIKISITDGNDDAIANAVKDYLNNNLDDFNYLKTAMNWMLVLDLNGSIVKYAFNRGVYNLLFGYSFISTFAASIDVFDPYVYSNAILLDIKSNNNTTVAAVNISTVQLLNSSNEWKLMVTDKHGSDSEENYGLLGIARINNDVSLFEFFNGSVALHDWITKAQQRTDFQIPTPTKPTDLVDKQYADSLATGGSSLSIELAVGASKNTADVFKTYLNNNASVLTQLRAASSFNLKVVKTTSVTTITETYKFDKSYTNTFTGVQYHFVCIYGSGQTAVQATVLWFSISDDTVSDLKLTTSVLSSGSTTE